MICRLSCVFLLHLVASAAGVECPENELSCSSEGYCMPVSYLCDYDTDCSGGEDEDDGLCQELRLVACRAGRGSAECTRGGISTCVSLAEYCSYTDPPCTGLVDPRLCQMMRDKMVQRLEDIMVESTIPEVSEDDLEESEHLAEGFKLTLNQTIGHHNCPQLYTKIGGQCVCLFAIGSVSWGESRAFCQAVGGDLITIRDADHYAALVTHLDDAQLTNDFWIGGRYLKETEEWTWVDDVPMELGTPFWGVRYHADDCVTRNHTMDGVSNTKCYNYVQAPRMKVQGSCVAITFQHYYYMSDEDCLSQRSPLCVLNGKQDDPGNDNISVGREIEQNESDNKASGESRDSGYQVSGNSYQPGSTSSSRPQENGNNNSSGRQVNEANTLVHLNGSKTVECEDSADGNDAVDGNKSVDGNDSVNGMRTQSITFPSSEGQYPENNSNMKDNGKNSGFRYSVINDLSDFGHEENVTDSGTQGAYHVLLPDGRRQKVTYNVSGGSGFVAEVEYEEHKRSN